MPTALVISLIFLFSCSPAPNPKKVPLNPVKFQGGNDLKSVFLSKVSPLDGNKFFTSVYCVDNSYDCLQDPVMQKEINMSKSAKRPKSAVMQEPDLNNNSEESTQTIKKIDRNTGQGTKRRGSEPALQSKTMSQEANSRRKSFDEAVSTSVHEKALFSSKSLTNLGALYDLQEIPTNTPFSIVSLEHALHARNGASKHYFNRQKGLKDSLNAVNCSRQSLDAETAKAKDKMLTEFQHKKDQLIEDIREELASVSGQLDETTKKLGEAAAFVLLSNVAKAGQHELIKESKRPDGAAMYSEKVLAEVDLFFQKKKSQDSLSEMAKSALDNHQVTLMMRKVSDQGLIAFAMGRPSKRLELKAKSDVLGNIPVDQVFSHKVKGDGNLLIRNRAMFTEFSYQSIMRLLSVGLPNSFSKQETQQVHYLDGTIHEFIGIKNKNA
ncbi:MAG: hypothetical protein OXE99_08085, partial [Cellvibrionales bacterium]|nr:hypothetical protein [Cellvibrionales bacterium]